MEQTKELIQCGDYFDINPVSKGHQGWRYGEVIKIDEISDQLLIGYYDDKEYHEIFIHLNDKEEIAQVGTRSDTVEMLKQHIYDPYFNAKKDPDVASLSRKLSECFNHIEQSILPSIQTRQQQNTSAVSVYLCDLYQRLYMESIAASAESLVIQLSYLQYFHADVL